MIRIDCPGVSHGSRGGGKMSSSAAGLSTADWTIIDDDDGAACSRQEISSRHPGDAGADYTDICAQILGKRLELWHFSCGHPDGGRMT